MGLIDRDVWSRHRRFLVYLTRSVLTQVLLRAVAFFGNIVKHATMMLGGRYGIHELSPFISGRVVVYLVVRARTCHFLKKLCLRSLLQMLFKVH